MLKPVIYSSVLVAFSIALIVLSRPQSKRSITVLCAPSLTGPMEELKRVFAETTDGEDVAIEITYRGSAELLPLYQISGVGDVLIAADTFYHDAFAAHGLCDQPMLLGRQIPCLIYTDLTEKQALAMLDFATVEGATTGDTPLDTRSVSIESTTSLPKPDHAAIGRTVASIIGSADYQRMIASAKVTRETVSQVAADVSNRFVDLGIAWTTTSLQFPNLNRVVPEGWESFGSSVGASIMTDSPYPDAAKRFRKLLGSPRGQAVFSRYGFGRATRRSQRSSLSSRSQPKPLAEPSHRQTEFVARHVPR